MKKTCTNFLLLASIFILLATSCKKSSTTETPIPPGPVPILTTTPVTDIMYNSAVSGGLISSDGGAVVTARGVCWSKNQTPTIADSKTTDGNGAGLFTSNITGLTLGASYYLCAYATNKNGTGYGSIMTFTTSTHMPPTLSTDSVINVTAYTALCGGNVTTDNGNPVTERGVCWSTNQNPTIADSKIVVGTGMGTFKITLSGLTSNTVYFVRAYATNSVGTAYGNSRTFTTGNNTLIDIEGNIYHFVTIGTQVWMVENLQTTKYRNGDPIPNVTDNNDWNLQTYGAYCNYNNDIDFSNVYGHLYNWFVVGDSRNIAPLGWHVPTIEEWNILNAFVGGSAYTLKEMGTAHWQDPNFGTNFVGFTALPNGWRDSFGAYSFIGESANWWTSTQYASDFAAFVWLSFDDKMGSVTTTPKKYGFAIRCIRD